MSLVYIRIFFILHCLPLCNRLQCTALLHSFIGVLCTSTLILVSGLEVSFGQRKITTRSWYCCNQSISQLFTSSPLLSSDLVSFSWKHNSVFCVGVESFSMTWRNRWSWRVFLLIPQHEHNSSTALLVAKINYHIISPVRVHPLLLTVIGKISYLLLSLLSI